jgi:type VI secretion system secreted protein Hcp
MSLNALMKISRAAGESKVKTAEKSYENYIELQGWEWEVEADTSWTKGGGASVGKPNPGKLSFEHYFDTASCNIMRYIFSGQSFDTIDLHMLKGTGDMKGQKEFFVMNMKDAFITKVTNTATDDGNVVQKVELVFKEVTFVYRPQSDPPPAPPGKTGSGGPPPGSLGADRTVTWDIPAGKVK